MADENIRDETQQDLSGNIPPADNLISFPPENEVLQDDDQVSDVLLVADQENGTLEAVSDIDEHGNLKTVPADEQHQNEFLKIGMITDMWDVIQTALKNYVDQKQNPTRFKFFRMPVNVYRAFSTSSSIFKAMLNDLKTEGTKKMAAYQVEPGELDFNDPKLQKILHKYLKSKQMENQPTNVPSLSEEQTAQQQQQSQFTPGAPGPIPEQNGYQNPHPNGYDPNQNFNQPGYGNGYTQTGGYPQQGNQPYPNPYGNNPNQNFNPQGYGNGYAQTGGYPQQGNQPYPNPYGNNPNQNFNQPGYGNGYAQTGGYPQQGNQPYPNPYGNNTSQYQGSPQPRNNQQPNQANRGQGYQTGTLNPGQPEQEKRYKFHPATIDEKSLQQAGVPVDRMKKNGDWDRMLRGWDSVYVYNVNIKSAPVAAKLEGRARFQPESINSSKVSMHFTGRHQKLDLSRPFKGYIPDLEGQKNLLEKGYLGKTAMLTYGTGIKESLVTIDKETNLMYGTPVTGLYIPDQANGYKFTEYDKNHLRQGGAIRANGLISATTQSEFDGEIYIDARTRNLAYNFEPKNAYEITKIRNVELSPEQLKTIRSHGVIKVEGILSQSGDPYDRFARINPLTKSVELTSYNPLSPEHNREIIIPKTVAGVSINTPEDQERLANGQEIYIYDMRKNDGTSFSSYFKLDMNNGDYMYSDTPDGFDKMEKKWNIPDQMWGVKITPAVRAGLQDGEVFPMTFQGATEPFQGYLWYDMAANHTQVTNYDPRQRQNFEQNQQQGAQEKRTEQGAAQAPAPPQQTPSAAPDQKAPVTHDNKSESPAPAEKPETGKGKGKGKGNKADKTPETTGKAAGKGKGKGVKNKAVAKPRM